MEITKREIVASISIIAIMLLVGILISGKISEAIMDANEKYNKATKINSSELFRYGMDTNIGNAFVYGELKAIDTVSFPEISGEYLSATKVKEKYTMHTRIVTETDSNGKTHTRTEIYWTWDEVSREKLKSKKVVFCDIEFDHSQFNKQNEKYIDTIQESSSIRYQYYGCPPQMKGTIFAYLTGGNLGENGAVFYSNKTITETVEYLESDLSLVAFWIFWILLICLAVGLFYYAENNWLE